MATLLTDIVAPSSIVILNGTQTLTNKTINGNSNTIALKSSAVAGTIPQTTDLTYGELSLNYADGKIYYKGSDNLVRPFSSSTGSLFVYGRSANTIITLTSGVLSVTGRAGSIAVTV